jgi:ribosomal-protein-alanine N-acetyltransferase
MDVAANSIENIETARLIGRRIREDDFALLHEMHSNPEVMATLGGLRSKEETRKTLTRYLDDWRHDGFGLWILNAKSDGRFVGRGGVRRVFVGGNDEAEAGYALMPEYWGQGIATEIANAAVRIALTHLGLSNLVAFTLPTNLASRRVMEKCGFVFERDIVWKDLPHVLYRLRREAYDGLGAASPPLPGKAHDA